MNSSEQKLLEILDTLDALVSSCVSGSISFSEFKKQYGYPIGKYALDGHESDVKGKQILAKLQNRIILHERIAEEVFQLLCSEQDAEKQQYKQAGRIGPDEAFTIMCQITRDTSEIAT